MEMSGNRPQGAPGAQESREDVAERGCTLAILSYALGIVFFPFFLVPLILRQDDFSVYHAKQCLLVWLIGLAAGQILLASCIGLVLVPIMIVLWLVLHIIGTVHAVRRETTPLPVTGRLAEEWFKDLFNRRDAGRQP